MNLPLKPIQEVYDKIVEMRLNLPEGYEWEIEDALDYLHYLIGEDPGNIYIKLFSRQIILMNF